MPLSDLFRSAANARGASAAEYAAPSWARPGPFDALAPALQGSVRDGIGRAAVGLGLGIAGLALAGPRAASSVRRATSAFRSFRHGTIRTPAFRRFALGTAATATGVAGVAAWRFAPTVSSEPLNAGQGLVDSPTQATAGDVASASVFRDLTASEAADPSFHLAARPSFEPLRDTATWTAVGSPETAIGPVSIGKKTLDNGDRCFLSEGFAPGLNADEIGAIIADIEATPQWSQAGHVDGKILSNEPGKATYWQVAEMPAMTFQNNRFWVVDSTMAKLPDGAIEIAYDKATGDTQTSGAADVKAKWPSAQSPNVVRGLWTLQPAEGGTRVRYAAMTGAGLAIPSFIENSVLTSMAPKAISALVEEARRRRNATDAD